MKFFFRNITNAILLLGLNMITSAQYQVISHFPRSNNYYTLSGNIITDGTSLYGMSQNGGPFSDGCIYKVLKDGSGFEVIHDFSAADGRNPVGSLVLYHDTLFGVLTGGGGNNMGCVFRIHKNGSGYQRIFDFDSNKGWSPKSSLTFVSGALFGMCNAGGLNGAGCIYKIDISTNKTIILSDFYKIQASNPYGTLTESDGVLYGITIEGSDNHACIFSFKPDGSGFKVVVNVSPASMVHDNSSLLIIGDTIFGELHQTISSQIFKVHKNGLGLTVIRNFKYNDPDMDLSGSLTMFNNRIYGMTTDGEDDKGSIFSMNTSGGDYKKLFDFGGIVSGKPNGGLFNINDTLYGITQEILFRIQPDGSNYHVVMRNHYCPKGYYPCAGLIMDKDTLYGITAGGGEFEKGSIFRMSKDGIVFDSLYSINESNGGLSYSELLSAGSWLYGASMYGGLNNIGYIFKVRRNGSGYTKLKEFSSADGYWPCRSLILYSDSLVGICNAGGQNDDGCIFKMDTNGSGYRIVHSFKGTTTGRVPSGSLCLYNGRFYGTTALGGIKDSGCIYSIDPDGKNFQKLHDFNGIANGNSPRGALVASSGGVLYGTTFMGGSCNYGTVFRINSDGSGFQKIHDFSGIEGFYTESPVILDGNHLFGLIPYDITSNTGALYVLNTDGTGFTILNHFNTNEGANPVGKLVLKDSILYGVASTGGQHSSGVVFRYSIKKAVPDMQAYGISVTDITSVKADVNWHMGSGIGHAVFVREGNAGTVIPSNNTTYLASPDWNKKGTQIGSSGYYCVYNGSSLNVQLSGLTPDKVYQIVIFDYNGYPGAETYLTTIGTGNAVAFQTLLKSPQTIMFNPLPVKQYGNGVFNLSAIATSGLPVSYVSSSPLVQISGNTVKILGAGSFTITAIQSGDTIYGSATPVERSLIVNKAPITATVYDYFKTYGDPNPPITIHYSTLLFNDSISDISPPDIILSATTTSNVGTYDIGLSGGSADNYYFSSLFMGRLLISKATLFANCKSIVREPGQPVPLLEIKYTGFKNGDDENDLAVKPVPSCLVDEDSSPGTYLISIKCGMDENYNVICGEGNVYIWPAEINSSGFQTDIYPNPVSDKIYISTGSCNTYTVSLTDMNGRVVYSTITSGSVVIDVAGIAAGFYLAVIKNNESTVVKKLMIE